MTTQRDTIIGRNVAVDFIGHASGIPAKVDTGAHSSSVWVSNVTIDDSNVLRFVLFDRTSPYYTGEVIKRTNYQVAIVRSSTGTEQIRYKTAFSVKVGGRRIKAMLTLSDRSKNTYPVLIGRRTLQGKFVVDVRRAQYPDKTESALINQTHQLNDELQSNPHRFHVTHTLKKDETI